MATTLEQLLPILAELSRDRDRRRSLAELSRQAGRSASSFQRAFSRIVGESPKQYTRRLALECAAVLLLTTKDSVLDVALAAGFGSHEGFCRAFASQFGMPPKEFRKQGVASGLHQCVRHASLVTHVGPCLGLYRASLSASASTVFTSTASTSEAMTMNYDITIQSFEPTTLLCQSARCEHAAIAKSLGQILPAVYRHVTTAGIEMVGPPVTIYQQWGPGMVTIQAGIPVVPGVEGHGDIEVVVLEAGPAAVTIHTGSYDGLGDAYAAVEQYLHQVGRKPNGPVREVYLTDPGEVPNPDDWKTQIIWPVEA